MDNQKDIFINKKLNIQRKYIVKKNINNIDILDDSKGKIKVLDFEGHTKINKIISPSLKELHNYTGIIDDKLISNCPNLTTIYLNKLSEINLNYNKNSKIKKVYFYFNNIWNTLYKFSKNEILTKLNYNHISFFRKDFKFTVENDFEKKHFNRTFFVDEYFDSSKYCLKKISDNMVVSNTLHIPDKYEYINLENLSEYKIDRLLIGNSLNILGDSEKYKQIKTIYFSNENKIRSSEFDNLKNLQFIEYLYNDKIITIQIPDGYSIIPNMNNSFEYCTCLYFSNGYNTICYHINNDIVNKSITINDNSEYYDLEKNSIKIPSEYDSVLIDLKNLNNINLTIDGSKKLPDIHMNKKLVIDRLFIKNDMINTLDDVYGIDINLEINYIRQQDRKYILKGIHRDYIVINSNYYKFYFKKGNIEAELINLEFQKYIEQKEKILKLH